MNSSKIIILLLIRVGKGTIEIQTMYSKWYNYYSQLILDDLIIHIEDDIDYQLTDKGIELTDQILQAYKDFS